jgi:hypothetical protein
LDFICSTLVDERTPGLAAPASGTEIRDFEALAADPEIAPLLNFDPVVRKVKRPDGWTPELRAVLSHTRLPMSLC